MNFSIIVLLLLFSLSLWLLLGKKNTTKAIELDNTVKPSKKSLNNDFSVCCNQHSDCDIERLRKKISKEMFYFNDEELDQYKGFCSSDYSDEDIEEFRYVLYTMRQEEVMEWIDSLQKREIELPDSIKTEARLLISE
ncbi:MAG TPA: phospholipase [Bacteroidaceae bacterium]|nr:phospholipase [Bacteroidaceae bacterium]